MELEHLDPHGWAKKPRSQKAFELLLDLVKEKEPAFVEIYLQLKQDGRFQNEKLLQRWDHVSCSWVKA